jgi:hypothetical protein
VVSTKGESVPERLGIDGKKNRVYVKATGHESRNWITLAHDRTSSGLV